MVIFTKLQYSACTGNIVKIDEDFSMVIAGFGLFRL